MRFINRLTFALFVIFAFSPVLAPITAKAQTISAPSSMGGQAESRFTSLANELQKFAWIILLVMVIIAGLMFLFGQQKMAFGVLVAGIIIGGGPYVIGVIYQGLN